MRKRNLVPAAFLATALMVEGAIALSRRHGQSSVTVLAQTPAVAPEVEVKVETSVEDAPGISRGILTASPRDH